MTSFLRIALGVFLVAHGTAHLVGFAVPWKLVRSDNPPYRTTLLSGIVDVGPQGIKVIGLLWLLLAIGVVALGAAILVNRFSYVPALWIIGASFLLSIMGWPDARVGVAINAALLASFIALRG